MEDKEDNPKHSRGRGILLVVILFVAFIVAVTVGLVLFYGKEKKTTEQIFNTKRTSPLVACPPVGDTKAKCESISGCIWRPTFNNRAPKCVFEDNVGYTGVVSSTPDGSRHTATLTRKGLASIYGMDVYQKLIVTVEEYNEKALRIYIKPESSTNHWEIGDELLKLNKSSKTAGATPEYNVTFVQDPVFGIVVTRTSTGKTIFNTSIPGLIFTEQFLQISTLLPSDNVYGFGEHNHRRFRHDTNWRTWPIFTRDMHPDEMDWNLYGAHPVHMSLDNDGKASVVFLKNSHAMDVTLQPEPYPALTYRVVGGVFDFYIFTGPTPKEAVQQYLEAVGRPPMPPYWALGFHLCRWGYGNLTNLKEVYERNRLAGIPQDAQWGDIDYMYEKYMFTYDRTTFDGLPEFVDQLHANGQKFVVILDPGIGSDPEIIPRAQNNSPGYDVYQDGRSKGVLIKDADGREPLVGKVWPGLTVFPDFTNPNTTDFWMHWIKYFLNNESINVDGLWIDMNEPASFVNGSINRCERNKWNYPPYVPPILDGDQDGGNLFYKTICMDAQQHSGSHYQLHSLYGHSEAIATRQALLDIHGNKRPFILTRSSFAGTGHYSYKWMGDNASKWPHMHYSIIGLLEFSIFGFSLNGADICGFFDDAQREMCIRWFQLGAFYPFARNHNIEHAKDQDPAAWDDEFIQIVKRSLITRYTLLPYFYSVFKDSYVSGETVARPLMFEFPDDKNTWGIDKQFLFGANLLVSPVLEEGKREVEAYFPKGRWYLYHDGTEVSYEESGKTSTLPAPIDTINVHIRGGSILPVQEPANTTKYSRLNPFGLLVAPGKTFSASGELYFDDGESLDNIVELFLDSDSFESKTYLAVKFSLSKGEKLDLTVVNDGYIPPGNLTWKVVDFYGFKTLPRDIEIDGVKIKDSEIGWNVNIARLNGLSLDISKNHTIQWKIY